MKLNKINFFLFFLVAADLSKTVLSFDSKCPPLKLTSGRSRYRWRGRSVRFNCMKGYQLVGVKYATCMNGKWDAKVPICVKYGCRAPSTTHVNGQFIESYRGAVVKIVCNPGYSLIGSPSVYCNGHRWNETFPVCRVNNTNPALSCDFEDQDLCGWSQDPMHDFDWTRQNGSTPSGETGTGPSFDHTKGVNGTGHYMYIESSHPRMENDTARLYSPVYPPEYSNGTCFKFWYHMYGGTTGYLKVYVKPEGTELYNIIPSFWMYGNQGEAWIQSFFHIDSMKTPFQIVIEGIRGEGSAGDTAVDDVSLIPAEECALLDELTSTTEFPTSVNTDDDRYNCKNRCNQSRISDEEDFCECTEACESRGTCCPNYYDYCVYFSPETSTKNNEMSTSSSPTTPPSIEPEKEVPAIKPPPKHYNNESNEIDPKKPFVHAPNGTENEIPEPTTTSTSLKSTTARVIVSKPTPPREVFPKPTPPRVVVPKPTPPREVVPKPTPPQVVVPKPTPPREKIPKQTPSQEKIPKPTPPKEKISKPTTPREKIPKPTPPQDIVPKPVTSRTKPQKKVSNASSNAIPRREFRPVVVKPEVRVKSTTITSSSTSTTTPRIFKNPNTNNVKLTFPEKPSNPNESRFAKGKPKEVLGKESPQAIKINKSRENEGGTIQGVIEIGCTTLALLVIVIFGVCWYKRRESRKTERENLVEDSDVRFLTSDEVLDFTLARPADDDL